MHTAQDQFVAHVFHCEPSAGALCKTIEAACKVSTGRGRQGGGVIAGGGGQVRNEGKDVTNAIDSP